MVCSRAGSVRRIFRVLPAASRVLAHLRLPSHRRSPEKDLLQERTEAGPGDRRQSLPKLKLIMSCTPHPGATQINVKRKGLREKAIRKSMKTKGEEKRRQMITPRRRGR